ncbi:hypothetical protein IFM89_031236 [Coptis chinensis]|uniref:Uncharacterized protein n=1 Tax=Coptis chinensis TaxID=261450 RepID=A0A835M7C9_9MAGN|nr:hypothetical protein IFM89_031236 [Coptis chinensis]
MNKQNPDKIHGRVDSWKAGHERCNGTVLESARARYELVEAAQKKRKSATSSGEGSATHLDFDNDELTEVLGADKKSRTRGISSNLSKKQLKRTSIAKVMLAQARSSSNSEFKGEMSEMKSSIARVEGVLMDMLKLVTNNGMSNSQPPHGDTTPGTDVGSNSVRRLSQYDANGSKARTLEQSIGIHVIRHGVKKPGGSAEDIEKYFGCEASLLIMVDIYKLLIFSCFVAT